MIHTKGKSLQEIVDEIAGVLDAQGKQCLNWIGVCAYGDDEGNHCAVGWLLPEERSDIMKYMPGATALADGFEDLGPNDQFIRENEDFLRRIQQIHDQAGTINRMSLEELVQTLPEVSIEKFKNFYETGGTK